MTARTVPPVAIAVAAGLCWAVLDSLMRIASAYLDAPTSAAMRIAGGALLLAVLNAFVFKKRIRIGQVDENPLLVALAVLNGLVSIALTFAIEKTTLGNAIFLLYAEPVFAAVLAYLFLGERFGKKTAAALALAVGGLALIFQPTPGSSLEGNAAGLVAGLGFATIIVISRKISGKVDAIARTFWMFAISVLVLLPFARLPSIAALPAAGWLAVLAMAAFLAAAVLLFNTAVTYLDATTTGIILLSEPVGATVMGALFFGEVYGPAALAGFALVGAGGALAAGNAKTGAGTAGAGGRAKITKEKRGRRR